MTLAHRRTWRSAAAVAAVLAGTLAVAACGSSRPAGQPAAGGVARLSGPTLATSLAGTDGTSWAVIQMGGSASAFNNFWELFARPADGTGWKLVTPAGVASNGGLVMTQSGPGALVTGFRPSQDLTFSPLAASTDAGAQWSQQPPLSPGLANVPGALAGSTAGRLLALTDAGDVDAGTGVGAAWTRLTTLRMLAGSPAGRACGLTTLTAVSWSPADAPLVAGDCSKPGAAGIFTLSSGTWRATGPTLAGPAARTGADVIGLATTDGHTTAVLAVGSGATAAVLTAWSADGGAHWTLSPTLPARPLAAGATPSVSFLADGSTGLVLTATAGSPAASRAYLIGWQAGRWDTLPPLPAGNSGESGGGELATLAASSGGGPQALVVDHGALTVWQLGSGRWALLQTVRVSLPYGSSS
jgi:hypothetical protein